MKMIFAAAALAAAAVAAPAMAQPMMGPVSGYANLGYAYAHEDPVNLSAVQGRLGVRGSYFGVEGQGAFGLGDGFGWFLGGGGLGGIAWNSTTSWLMS